MQWYWKCWRNYATFSGRARRREFWIFHLVSIVILIVLGSAFIVSLPQEFSDTTHLRDFQESAESLHYSMYDSYNIEASELVLPLVFLGICILYALAITIPSLAVAVRRLHDTGRSGWWLLIGFAPLGIGNIVLFIFQLMDSEEGHNAYGSNPKGIANNVD